MKFMRKRLFVIRDDLVAKGDGIDGQNRAERDVGGYAEG